MSKSAVFFLAGHGAVSAYGTPLEDVEDHRYLRSHHIVFPSQKKGQLCFVAHNLIFQGLMRSDDMSLELRHLETVHGVCGVDARHRGVTFLSEHLQHFQVNLNDIGIRNELHLFVLKVGAILRIIDNIDKSGLGEVFEEQNFVALQTGIFSEERIGAWFGTGIIHKIKDDIESLLELTVPIEHALGSWDKSMLANPWQSDMPYIPSSHEDYMELRITSQSRAKSNRDYVTSKAIKLHINKKKLSEHAFLSNEELNDNGFIPKHLSFDQLIYMTTSSEKHILLSEILDILHELHIFVSTKTSSDSTDVKIRGAYVIKQDELDYISPMDFDTNADDYTWYDYTVPDDANIVWGACRDTSDAF